MNFVRNLVGNHSQQQQRRRVSGDGETSTTASARSADKRRLRISQPIPVDQYQQYVQQQQQKQQNRMSLNAPIQPPTQQLNLPSSQPTSRATRPVSYFGQYVPPQPQAYTPQTTPQINDYAFPGVVNVNVSQPLSAVGYPTPGLTPTATPGRYVLPSVVASQMEVDAMPQDLRQQNQMLNQQRYSISEHGYSMNEWQWQEALQAQQQHELEWQLHLQQQQEEQQRQQQAQDVLRQQQQREMEDRRASIVFGSRNRAQEWDKTAIYEVAPANQSNGLHRASVVHHPTNPFHLQHSQSDSVVYTQHQEQDRFAEENFYNTRTIPTTRPAQFTPDSNTPPKTADQLPAPELPGRSFSVNALSTNSYPIPQPVSNLQRLEQPSTNNLITQRFPNFFMDGSANSDEDDVNTNKRNHKQSKKRRTLGELEGEDVKYWGIFLGNDGVWSRMWYKLLDGIYHYYARTKSAGLAGLNPKTLGIMWEEMGYTVEENLYQSQIHLAQSLFHPDPEDFVSTLLTKYFSLLSLEHIHIQPPVQPPPSFLPECVNPTPPVPIPLLTREGFQQYMIHQALLDPQVAFERFNCLLKRCPTGIVDPETSLPFIRRETGGGCIPRNTFPAVADEGVEEVEEGVRRWMREWVGGEIEGWVRSESGGMSHEMGLEMEGEMGMGMGYGHHEQHGFASSGGQMIEGGMF